MVCLCPGPTGGKEADCEKDLTDAEPSPRLGNPFSRQVQPITIEMGPVAHNRTVFCPVLDS